MDLFSQILGFDRNTDFSHFESQRDPVPLIEKSRTLCPSGMFPPTFIHQVIIIPGLNILVNNCGKISQYIYEINLGGGNGN